MVGGPRKIGRYYCEELLARGAHSETHRARLFDLGAPARPFVIRVLTTEEQEVRQRFSSAVERAARLVDARIEQVVEAGVEGFERFVASEHVPGADLASVLARGAGSPSLPVDVVVQVAVETALALAAGQSAAQPVFHGALTAARIRLSERGDVVVVGFGVRAALRAPGELEEWRTCAPEVIGGADADARSDLYSLGAVLHQALGGRLAPSDATLPALERAALSGPPAPAKGAPPWLADVVAALLAPHREDRLGSATAAAEALLAGARRARSKGGDRGAVAPAEHDPATADAGFDSGFMLEGALSMSDEAVELVPAPEPEALRTPPPIPTPARERRPPAARPAIPPLSPPAPVFRPIAVDEELLIPPSHSRRNLALLGAAVVAAAAAVTAAVRPWQTRAPAETPRPAATAAAPAVSTDKRPGSSAPASAVAAVPEGAAPGRGRLRVVTIPEGAEVWIDKTHRGKSPLEIDAGPGIRDVVIIKPGFRMSRDPVEPARGALLRRGLSPGTRPPPGDAGIKVRCQVEGRYPVYVDGVDTGQVCPTERIDLPPGPHKVALFVPQEGEFMVQELILEESRGSTRVYFQK